MERLDVIKTSLNYGQMRTSALPHYRALSSVDSGQLSAFLFGKHAAYRKRALEFIVKNNKHFSHSFIQEQDRKQVRQQSARQLLKLMREDLQDKFFVEDPARMSLYNCGLYAFDLSLSVKFGVHYYLYYKTIYYLGSERHKEFCDSALNFKDIGCFALTQIMHGSNARGIITQARYDPLTQQFVIDTPHQYGMKFWIGASANLANYCVVWAQLYVKDVCHGVHAFIVPIRDKRTHTPLPGVTIGDCGPKMGLQGIDNGFLLFKKVRIPRTNLLNRLSDVTQKGQFTTSIESPDKRFGLQLGALSGGRVQIALSSTTLAEIAIVITLRYVLARKQFGPPGKPQVNLIQYPLTRARVMPMLAQCIVYHIAALDLLTTWDDNGTKVLDLKNNLIEFLHAISSIMKAKASWFCNQMVGECRQLMGGHGYSAFSRMGQLLNDNHINMTWQGDNNVLLMQTQKFILDGVRKIGKGKNIHSSLQFIRNKPQEVPVQSLGDLKNLQTLFQLRVHQKIQQSVAKMFSLKSEGSSDYDVFNQAQPGFLNKLASCFGDLHYLKVAISKSAQLQGANRAAVQTCIRLWAYRQLQRQGYGCRKFKEQIDQLVLKQSQALTKDAVRITEAFAPPNDIIGSPFADQQGKAFDKYINLLYRGKGTFERVSWWKDIHS